MAQEESWSLNKGPYLGDVSALCFLYRPWESPIPYLLAGTGAQLLLYDIITGKLLFSSHVFDGIRVHGIHSSCCLVQDIDPSCCKRISTVTIAVYGERRVKLFDVQLNGKLDSKKRFKGQVSLDLLQIVPKFSHWVMDVRFLKGLNKEVLNKDYGAEEKVTGSLLVIGLSDNSICLWDTARSYLLFDLKCTERCLLYSMSFWGDSVETLCVASGTIYNEILIWKIVSQQATLGISSEEIHVTNTAIEPTNENLQNLHYGSILLNRLTGHEGSIFRIAWSCDGLKIISASDDRSARIWTCNFNVNDTDNPHSLPNVDIIAGPILFGHNARIWDCYISDKIIITASEDCTCRIWGSNGKHVATIKGHIGRGVWRCGYDPGTSILITAGSDSSIKMRHLNTQSLRHLLHGIVKDNDADDKMEVFKICLRMNLPVESREFIDSKSEYVRCLHLARESYLYVATNLGYLNCIDLTVPGEERWTTILKVNDKEPIVCLDVLIMESPDSPALQEDWVAIGDGKGRVTVVQLVSSNLKHEISWSFVWSAERERQLLGIYWCKSLGHRHLFTSDPKGGLKLWRLEHTRLEHTFREVSESKMVRGDPSKEYQASLVAEFGSTFLARIVCIDANCVDELLVCGDQRGNLVVFEFPVRLIGLDNAIMREKFQTFCSFKGAHGISSVASISVARSNGNQICICSTGKDGCICDFIFDKNATGDYSNKLIFAGIKNVPEIAMVEAVSNYKNSRRDGIQRKFAAGFTAADFILWDLTNESELLRVSCGGWRRPHSYFLGWIPEIQNCFAYLKDHTIYVLRNWVPDDQIKVFPQVLHTQFHGREIHSVHFIPMPTSLILGQNMQSYPKISWIATGSEDGTVRITRYSSKQIDKLDLSLLLGEHVGGSAVRSITTVSKVYTLQLEGDKKQDDLCCSIENRDSPLLLLSVGAKQVLTTWLLKRVEVNKDHHENELSNKLKAPYISNFDKFSLEGNHMISFQWLSTYMQPRFCKPPKKMANGKQKYHTVGIIPEREMPEVVEADSGQDEISGPMVKLITDDETQDDWRYLAVTAFLVQATDPRSTVCFVVTACSDATLSVQALLLPHRLWFEVAVLDHERAPVLALQHVVIPLHYSASENIQNIYLILSGATTGNIAVWDLTDIVNEFILKISAHNPGEDIVAQRRPRTGRGSQGGRRWRFSRKQEGFPEATIYKSGSANIDICNSSSGTTLHSVGEETILNTGFNGSENKFSEEQENKPTEQIECEAIREPESNFLNGLSGPSVDQDTGGSNEKIPMARMHTEIRRVHPLHVFYHAHQSGVNCLYISKLNSDGSLEAENLGSLYCIVSGGDDQALHIASFGLHVHQTEKKSINNIIKNERKDSEEQNEPKNGKLDKPKIASTILGGADDKASGSETSKVVYEFTCLNQEVIRSAHSSSVKGVWTDGHWVFSTGLDQRIRCWCFSHLNKKIYLREHCSSIINVPEPEALHAIANKERDCYQIAVVGRGMQIVEFSNYFRHQNIQEVANCN